MATTTDYIEFVMEQLEALPFEIRYKKMFGEYCVYANDKPILLVCDNMVYVKILPCVESVMVGARIGEPYCGAKPHYMLDIENSELVAKVASILEEHIQLPKPRHPRK